MKKSNELAVQLAIKEKERFATFLSLYRKAFVSIEDFEEYKKKQDEMMQEIVTRQNEMIDIFAKLAKGFQDDYERTKREGTTEN